MEIIKEFKSEEMFRIRNYQVGHSQLLLRGDVGDSEIIDLLFTEVFYIELPQYLNGLVISPATQEETNKIKSKVFNPYQYRQNYKVYAIASYGERYFIGAIILWISRYIYQPVGTAIPLGAEIATNNSESGLYREGNLNRVILASYRFSFD